MERTRRGRLHAARPTQCGECPISANCMALRHRTVLDLPPKRVRGETQLKQRRLLLIERNGKILLTGSRGYGGFGISRSLI